MRILSSFLAGCALAMIVFSAVGSTPESKLPQGHRYRYIWNSTGDAAESVTGDGIVGSKKILFPITGNAIGTATNRKAVSWVHITNWGNPPLGRNDHVIYSPTFPDGADTVSTHQNFRTRTFGGCQIDSVHLNVNTNNTFQGSVYATD